MYCFEPSKIAYGRLLKNDSIKNNPDNVKTYNFGFGCKNETVTLYSNYPGSVCSSIFDKPDQPKYKDAEDIQLICLDRFCKDNSIDHIHLLKLDVEGNEYNVLQGAEDLIQLFSIDMIQFEFGVPHIYSRVLFKDIYEYLNEKYRIHRISRNDLIPMDNYSYLYENFKTTNYLAISRRLMS